jgi:hypothetical protein
LTKRLRLQLLFDPSDAIHLDLSRLTVARWSPETGDWEPLASQVDSANGIATATTNRLGDFDVHAPLLCPQDLFEPDDGFHAARNLPTDGVSVSRVLDVARDEDWFRFDARGGAVYDVQVVVESAAVRAQAVLVDTDGLTDLVGGEAVEGAGWREVWEAPRDGTYFLRVQPVGEDSAGCSARYEVGVLEVPGG